MKSISKRILRAAISCGVVSATVLGVNCSSAWAGDEVTWQNNLMGCLEWKVAGSNGTHAVLAVKTGTETIPWPSQSCHGTGFTNTSWSAWWLDPIALAGTAFRVEQPDDGGSPYKDSTGSEFCLDSNTAGAVYMNPCNGTNWQLWHEIYTSYGWKLADVHTGRYLEAGNPVTTMPNSTSSYQDWH